jgi:hypothetical protein
MPRACPVVLTWQLPHRLKSFFGCHGLVPWWLTFVARLFASLLAINVKVHGSSPWHPKELSSFFGSCLRNHHGTSPWH